MASELGSTDTKTLKDNGWEMSERPPGGIFPSNVCGFLMNISKTSLKSSFVSKPTFDKYHKR